ncbi:heterokaryon incompatibility protein-domain-containing protein, partial [Cercophora newfieldiana]
MNPFRRRDPPKYIALSHRWGTCPENMPLRTLRANIADHMQQLPSETMPRSFRDVMTLARKLGVRYIWIDSLCIIQDDPADWQREAAQMASIYSGAYLTVAAACAEDSTVGCLPERMQASVEAYARPLDADADATPGHERDFVDASLLSSRGWILQEMVLSRRVLYVSKERHMYWQCRSLYQSEDGTLDMSLDGGQGDSSQPHDIVEHVSGTHTGLLKMVSFDTPIDSLATWLAWINNYARRSLTNPSDKLPALAGLVNHYQNQTKDEPLVGLWRKHLIPLLSW